MSDEEPVKANTMEDEATAAIAKAKKAELYLTILFWVTSVFCFFFLFVKNMFPIAVGTFITTCVLIMIARSVSVTARYTMMQWQDSRE